jgi:hypothetical protein
MQTTVITKTMHERLTFTQRELTASIPFLSLSDLSIERDTLADRYPSFRLVFDDVV